MGLDDEIMHYQRELFGWIPLKRYFKMFPEETSNAIRKRRMRKQWLEGVHIRSVDGMGTWVNLTAIKELLVMGKNVSVSDSGATNVGGHAKLVDTGSVNPHYDKDI